MELYIVVDLKLFDVYVYCFKYFWYEREGTNMMTQHPLVFHILWMFCIPIIIWYILYFDWFFGKDWIKVLGEKK